MTGLPIYVKSAAGLSEVVIKMQIPDYKMRIAVKKHPDLQARLF